MASREAQTWINAIPSPFVRRALNYLTTTAFQTGNLAATGTSTLTGAVTAASTITATGAIAGPRKVISGLGATRALTAAESGALVLFDKADGIVVTLPAPAVGLTYDFIVTTTITSNAAKVITDAGTTFLKGSYQEYDQDTSRATALRTGNGSTHVSVSMNGTTTGGIAGTFLRFTCDSATTWVVQGTMEATGAVATAFATS